ncbi:MAG: hypothetical protein Q27BPR15_16100 [Rhodobacter sp. CACIA14H1]|nr:MAG: hypothetical protein Q27BPR15_16100 [Rhodobacter sp. CACIA14H1]
MVETGLPPDTLATVLGLPSSVDLLNFNPFATGADPSLALEVEQMAHLVLGTIRTISETLEASGLTAAEAFDIATQALASAVTNSTTPTIDFTNTATLTSIFTTAIDTAENDPDFEAPADAVIATLTNALAVVNQAVNEATNLEDADAFSGPSNLVQTIDTAPDLAAPLFSASLNNGVISFEGAAGVISVSVTGNTATFTRAGFTDDVANALGQDVTLKVGEKLALDLTGYNAFGTISGAGVVALALPNGVYEFPASSVLHVLPDFADDAAAQAFFNGLDTDDIVYVPSGEHSFNVTLTKPVTILGANFGDAVHSLGASGSFTGLYDLELSSLDKAGVADAVQQAVSFDTSAQPRTFAESWINGKITVSSSNVTLDGLRLHYSAGGVAFSEVDPIDNFQLLNSYVTGHAAGSIAYTDADYNIDGETGLLQDASSGWRISGNLIGGVSTATGNGGSLYLTGLSDSVISENVFWRPGAAHLYLEDLSDVTLQGNFFYHGLHAGGANFDGLMAEAGSGYGYGYGEGYGYGSGYGYGYGGTGEGYYGRNYWLELKGVTAGVTIDSNLGLFNSGGIQVWDEESAANSFSDITISNNVFDRFINADPNGYLDSLAGTTRHVSGLMGGIVWSTVDASTSDGLTITNNLIKGDLGQLLNDGDIRSLVLIQGGVDDIVASGNILSWGIKTPLAQGALEDVDTAAVLVSRLLLDQPVDPTLVATVTGNSFAHETTGLPEGYSSAALLLDFRGTTGTDAGDTAVLFTDNSFTGYGDQADLLEIAVNSGSVAPTVSPTDPSTILF